MLKITSDRDELERLRALRKRIVDDAMPFVGMHDSIPCTVTLTSGESIPCGFVFVEAIDGVEYGTSRSVGCFAIRVIVPNAGRVLIALQDVASVDFDNARSVGPT